MPSNGVHPASAAFPGINGKIAFYRQVAAPPYDRDIYTIDPDGSNLTQLTSGPADELTAAWSPSGTQIAYASDGDILVMNADGSSPVPLTSSTAGDASPAWSPDGSKIAFSRDGVIYVMNSDGSGPTPLTTSSAAYSPAYSPDGTRILYVQLLSSGLTQIFVMNADGSGKTQLTFSSNEGAFGPDWSNDGSKIVFQKPTGNQDIFVMNADGTDQTDISNSPTTFDSDPVWSPDGYRIAFYRDGNISVMNADGSGVTPLTSGIGAAWQRIPGPTPTPTPCPTVGCPTSTPTRTATITPTPSATATPCPTTCPQVDFSIGVDPSITGAAFPCDSSGAPTTVCSVPLGAKFNVNVYLHSLPAEIGGGGYDAFGFYLGYGGVTATETKQAVDPFAWPDCVLVGLIFGPGTVQVGCAVGVGAPPSTYTGRMAGPEFTCTAGGTITLVHGNGNTSILDHNYAEFSEGSDESLTIQCVASQTYPGDTDGEGCPDAREQGPNPMMGGLRNFLNPWDFFNPTGDGHNRIDDVLTVAQHVGQNVGDPGYDVKYDRTYIGPNRWNLGPPDGAIRSADILAAVYQYGQDCG